MNVRLWYGVVILLLAGMSHSGAGAETNAAPTLTVSSGSLIEVVLRMLGALIVVFALFMGGVWLFKRSRFFSLYQGVPAQLKILESKSLGYRSNLMVVGYSHQRFLLAVSATGVRLISSLPSAPLTDGGTHPDESSAFSDRLSAVQAKPSQGAGA